MCFIQTWIQVVFFVFHSFVRWKTNIAGTEETPQPSTDPWRYLPTKFSTVVADGIGRHDVPHSITRRVTHHARSVAQSVLCATRVTGPRLCEAASQTHGLEPPPCAAFRSSRPPLCSVKHPQRVGERGQAAEVEKIEEKGNAREASFSEHKKKDVVERR